MKRTALIIAVLAAAGCTQAYAASHITGPKGMALYTFDKDKPGTSSCYGGCAKKWPPYFAKDGATAPGAGFTTVERKDGKMQWAKDGAPLYFWIGDKKPGDTKGDGVGGVWHLAK